MQTMKNVKIWLGLAYIIFLGLFLYFLFTYISIEELTSYSFIKSNSEYLINFKQNNLKVELTLKDCMVQSDGNYEYKTCFITTYYLAELNENRMVFYSGNAEFIGEYEAALVFEKI